MEEHQKEEPVVLGTNNEGEVVEIVTRNQWGALEAKIALQMITPVKKVYFIETDTRECSNKEECMEIIKGIQRYHIDFKGFDDIQFHFLVGGDGRIYEGRGWYTKGIEYPKQNSKIPEEASGKCIEIAFIGSFKDQDPTKVMSVAADSLIVYGIDNKMLDQDCVEEVEEDKADLNKENP